jgi:hypothetical protein
MKWSKISPAALYSLRDVPSKERERGGPQGHDAQQGEE